MFKLHANFQSRKTVILYVTLAIFSLIILFDSCDPKDKYAPGPTPSAAMKIALGKMIFFDKNLSNPAGQSCSSCHAPETAFTDLNHNDISPGAADGLVGNRNAPSVSYSMFTPSLHYSIPDSSYVGGFFWDGRVNSLTEQAQKPFLNPLEMANTDAGMVVSKVYNASYYTLYQQIYGNITDVNQAFNNIADAIAAYESSPEVNPFTSKYDYYLLGQASLSSQELRGLELFQDTLTSKCSTCHLITPDPVSGKILFTDHTYNNDGVPKNPNNPFYNIPSTYNLAGSKYVDLGLGDFLQDSAYYGQFKVPTLRNIALTAPYFHNGVFYNLEDVVHFYNTRNLNTFAAPEYAATVDTVDLGNLKLSAQQEADIIAFLKTLTDGYK